MALEALRHRARVTLCTVGPTTTWLSRRDKGACACIPQGQGSQLLQVCGLCIVRNHHGAETLAHRQGV